MEIVVSAAMISIIPKKRSIDYINIHIHNNSTESEIKYSDDKMLFASFVMFVFALV